MMVENSAEILVVGKKVREQWAKQRSVVGQNMAITVSMPECKEEEENGPR